MKRCVTLAAAAFLGAAFILAAFPARADIDYSCLTQCVANGGQQSTCLTQCSYDADTKTGGQGQGGVQPDADTLSSHRILSSPVPADGKIVLPPSSPPSFPSAPLQPDTDYACLSQCLHNGQTYDLCKQNCVKPDCIAGAIDCPPARKMLPGQP